MSVVEVEKIERSLLSDQQAIQQVKRRGLGDDHAHANDD
ncbi:hypothetical protein XOC_2947 [Xanthomonas oryzae pv. oryzicola BLS256]|uniref:Uncharacterized protein n=2 Tax=Xanthomonas oryzae TaxID=347 RepID=A0A0K0GMQ6_XANOP|nr:hypothetical protein PXO_01275 [Xanthomonas oryzae pv. oryzae PXO99A]AEQ97046.1 hypothetical protein XOC_2947 [Xanthomonas oryzae pv. oryzicola BLS256]QEO96839.1 hypothetical protein XOCgx_1847 [Xanthomonas oryzae pv. oryzicola]